MTIDLKPGEKFNNEQLHEIFGCSKQGGMRRSHATNSLVLISNHVDSIYDDRWINQTLFYTGMGSSGNQSLDFMQNKTLAESRTNGIDIYLFEVFKAKEYTYIGQVYLTEDPITEKQLDTDKVEREVYIFKLKILNGAHPLIDNETIVDLARRKSKAAIKISDEEIRQRAHKSLPKPGSVNTSVKQFIRNPWVSEYTKRLANGRCMLCKQEAPFKDRVNKPYLETHHIEWLSKGGDDSIYNTVALCPNCHRKMHVVNSEFDIEILKQAIKETSRA
jgi:5-methylcytosine-specific restriction enzyme A